MSSCNDRPSAFTPSPDVTSVVEGNTAFALDLYHQLGTQPGNLFFSPYSISTSLAMTYTGARGATAEEMSNTLHFTLPQKELSTAFKQLVARWKKLPRRNRIAFTTANSLWGQKGQPLTKDFFDTIHHDYQAEARSVDFMHEPGAAAREMNLWIAEHTENKILNLVDSALLTSDTSLALGSAIYFKGDWVNKFKTSATRSEEFSFARNQTVTIRMMHQKGNFRLKFFNNDTLEGISFQALELPYYGHDLSMVVFLPEIRELEEGQGIEIALACLEKMMTPENLRFWLATLDKNDTHKVQVAFPRFTTTQSFDLADTLKTLGMPNAFGKTSDFSGIDGTKSLFLSHVLHQAFVEVNESGTEAAATTIAIAKSRSMTDTFVANHPFIFLIRDNASGSILFLGRIIDPTK